MIKGELNKDREKGWDWVTWNGDKRKASFFLNIIGGGTCGNSLTPFTTCRHRNHVLNDINGCGH